MRVVMVMAVMVMMVRRCHRRAGEHHQGDRNSDKLTHGVTRILCGVGASRE
jgi:hypothetical protein